MLYAVLAGAALYLIGSELKSIFRKPGTVGAKGVTGVLDRSKLEEAMLIGKRDPQQPIHIHVFRQSGEWERSFTCEDRQVALTEAHKLFNRLKEPSVRIWKNDEKLCDLRRPYGSFKGTREGRKIWGCVLELG